MDNNNTESGRNPSFKEGSEFSFLEWAINKIFDTGYQFSSQEHMNSYTAVCNLSKSKQNAKKLYEKYQKTFEDYISSKVLPHLKGKNGEILLRELVEQWDTYRTLHKRLLGLSHSLLNTSHLIFYKLVYGEINDQVRDALISEINRERNGEEIDQVVVKNAVEIYVEMAEGSMEYYEKDFETAMLIDTVRFYSQKASEWLIMNSTDSSSYMQKVEDCLKHEETRVTNYLKPGSLENLLQVVENELLIVPTCKKIRRN